MPPLNLLKTHYPHEYAINRDAMRINRNVTGAFLTASLISAALSVLLMPTATGQGLVSTLGMFALFYLISAAGLLVFGIPLYFFFSFANKVNWKRYLVGGVLLGLLVGLFIQYPGLWRFKGLAILGGAGGLSGIVFWLLSCLGLKRGSSKEK